MRARVGARGGNKRAANEYTRLAIGVVVLGSSDHGVNLVFVLRYGVRRFTKTPKKQNKTKQNKNDAEMQRRFKSIWDRHYWRTIIEQWVISRRRIVVKRSKMGSANKMVKHHHGASSNPARANTTAREGLQIVKRKCESGKLNFEVNAYVRISKVFNGRELLENIGELLGEHHRSSWPHNGQGGPRGYLY